MDKALSGVNSGFELVGKAKVWTMAIFWLVIIVVLCTVGFIVIGQNAKRSETTQAIVTNVLCQRVVDYQVNGMDHYKKECKIDVKYTVGSTPFTGMVLTNREFNNGETIKIYYNPTDPTDISYSNSPISVTGWIFMALFGITTMSIIGNVFFVQKSKAYAAYQGVDTIFKNRNV
jgi:hypothetical protein